MEASRRHGFIERRGEVSLETLSPDFVGDERDPFVGRGRELALLKRSLSQATAGHGRVVLLVGEPGIGKTRIAEELARHARAAGAEVLVGRCYEGEGAPAFWPWVQVLRAWGRARTDAALSEDLGNHGPDVAAIFPDLRARLPKLAPAPMLEGEAARFRIFDGVAGTLVRAAARRPVVILLDDLHGADESSLRLMQFLTRTLRDSRILVVGGLRPRAVSREHPLADLLGELVREQVAERIELEGLAEAQVAELLTAMTGWEPTPELVAAVSARTEGNPLYVREVARMLAASGGDPGAAAAGRIEIPDTVRLAIGRTLRGLSGGCRELLTLAALFGREFRIEALARASGLDAHRVLAFLDEAEAARIAERMAGDPERRRFAHALFGETLAEDLGEAARTLLHRRAAEALASDPRADEHAAEIAHHWSQAGPASDPEQAVAWARRAAERAMGLFAHEEAARLYRMAFDAVDRLPIPDGVRRAEVLLGLGEARKRAGEIDASRRAFLEVAAIARKLGSAELLTRAALGFAPAVTTAEQVAPDAAVIQLLEEAIGAWGGRDSGLHARALARLGLSLLFGDPDRLAEVDDAAVAMARRLREEDTLRYVLARSLSNFALRRSPGAGLGMATELVQLATKVGDAEALAFGRLWRAVNAMECDDVAEMRAEQIAFGRVAAELRQPIWVWYRHLLEVNVALLEGRFDDAERGMHEATAVGQSVLPFAAPAYLLSFLTLLRVLQGRAGEFAAEYRSMFEGHPSPGSLSILAFLEAERGNSIQARHWLERVTAGDFAFFRKDVMSLVAAWMIADACALVGDRSRAAWLYDFLAPHARSWLVLAEGMPLGPVSRALGVLARVLGRLDDAAAHFDAAHASAVRAGSPTILAPTQYRYALLLRERDGEGDAQRAALLLTEARWTAASIGMLGIVAKIDALESLPPRLAAESPAPQVIRREGEVWTLAYGRREIRLRDVRGLHYLATLLREPGREFHVCDLVGVGNGGSPPARDPSLQVVVGLGDAGARIDARARAAYRTRLGELEEELTEAERLNDLGRLEHARAEREALVAELSGALRASGEVSHAERARVAVTKAIKAALDRIKTTHPELGSHLQATVRRGTFCSYVPDPRHPIEWEV